MIKVSVIMPIYNAEKYLGEALDCLISQTLKEIEIICVDDGSEDHSLDILRGYSEKDSRIRVLSQKNSGAGVARNLGIQYAAGEYLSILDADDIFEVDMLEAAYKKALETFADICVFKADEFVMNDIRHKKSRPNALSKRQLPDFEPFTYRDITGNIFTAFKGWTWDKLFRRAFVLEHQLTFQALRTTNDMFFTFAALVKAEKIAILSRTLVHQRVGLKNSLSSTRENSWDCFYQALLALREELVQSGIYKEVERSYINYALVLSLWHLDTLKPPAFQALYEKLKGEFFAELGISNKKKNYFWNQNEYEKYQQIKSLPSDEYRIRNGLQPRYKEFPYRIRQMEKTAVPKVSIIVPIYNVEHYLVECLNSVVNQTLEDIEIVCINDGSTDNSLEIIKKYAEFDKRIVILDGSNGGYGKAMNRGLDVARGDYIGILESDDYVELNMYERLYQVAVKENLDIIKADVNYFKDTRGEREFVREQIARAEPKLYNRVISPKEYPDVFKFPLNTGSGIYRSSLIKDNQICYNETPGASYQDSGFWFQTFCFAERMYFLDQTFYQCRRDNLNSSVCDKEKVYCLCEEYGYIYGFLERHPEFKERYIGYYQFKKYYDYIFNLNRIADEKKLEFVNRFHREFKEAFEKNELLEEVFCDDEWERVQKLIDRPMDFYASFYVSAEVIQLKKEVALLKASKSWKIGSAIMYLPKKILRR